MADVTITGLPNATVPLSGSERVPMDQNGTTVDATTQDVANLAPGTDLSYTAATRTLASSTGDDAVLPLATNELDGLMSAAHRALTAALAAAGVTVEGSAVVIPHIHGSIAGNFYIHVRNTSGAPLNAGTAVYVTGSVGDTDRLTVAACDPTNTAKMPAVAILETTLANNGDGDAIILGELRPFNTAAFSLNQPLYVGAGGVLTGTVPISGIVQAVGTVARVQSNTGTIVVHIGDRLGTAALRAVGTGAGTVAAGDDARFTDARTPTAHKATHATGGADALSAADIGAEVAGAAAAAQAAAISAAASDATAKANAAQAAAIAASAPAAQGVINGNSHDHSGGDGAQIAYGSLSGLPSIPGPTDLSYTPSSRLLVSSTGADVTLPEATTTLAGLMSGADKTKLDGVAAGAQGNVNADWNASSGDAQILNKPSIPAPADATPLAPGTAAVGTSTEYAREDHVHPLPGLVTSTEAGLMRPVDLGDVIVLVCSDETTDLTTGTTKARVKLPFAYTLTAVKADVNESDPPTGSGLVVDINEAGTSVLSTKLSIDADESTSDTAATPAVISDAALARNAEITIDIDQVGSTNPGKGLKVALYVTRVQA